MATLEKPVIVVGAGLAGSLMAVYLARKGYTVEVFERRPDMRRVDISAGKSINLAISVRGLHALSEVGLEQDILNLCIPMPGRMIHALDGSTQFQPYSKDGKTAINSLSRGLLNMRLMDLAESHSNVRIHFHERCVDMNPETGEASFRHEETGQLTTVQGQTVIGTDGAFSGVRQAMFKTPRFDYSQDFLAHGYKELTIPGLNGGWQMEKHALHIWPRGTYMLIALPNLDGSFTVTLFFPHTGEFSFQSLNTGDKVRSFFAQQFPDALALMPELEQEFFGNPTGELVTVRCNPWVHRDKLALAGDAAHAVVPFYGQGMNCAFEDCTELNRCIGEAGGDWARAYSLYQDRRIANANAIADMAKDNFIEMRDKTGDPQWQFRKKIEHLLEHKFPGQYISKYEMVSFTRTPYAEAQRRGALNEQILLELSQGIRSVEEVDLGLAEKLVQQYR